MFVELTTRSASPREILSGDAGDGFAMITVGHDNRKITERHMTVLIALEESSRLGTTPHINGGNAEECVNLELVQTLPGGSYSLTEAGLKILREKANI